jgi:FkbM family methyltransferase
MRSVERLRALAGPFALSAATHLLRLRREPEYREHWALQVRLAGLPRRRPGRARCSGLEVEFLDAASFLSAHRAIFADEIYRLPFEHDAPSIVDLGANVGLATLWFKKRYPRARVLALEPDPAMFACLERNVSANGCSSVELLNCAAWNAAGEMAFLPDGADGGRVLDAAAAGARQIRVRTLAIGALLADRPVDVLKIDIEGAEDVVIADCAPILSRVRCLFVEYHARRGAPSALGGIVRLLEQAGFRLYVENAVAGARPFASGAAQAFDLQLNLAAWRPA